MVVAHHLVVAISIPLSLSWLMCCLMITGSDKFPMNSVNGHESFLTFF